MVRKTRAEQQERTRERLLEAAAKVFARRGYHAATLAEVADAAGLSTGAVYSNFAGKEELFLALADRHIKGRLEQVAAAAEAGGDPERLRAELTRQVAAGLQDPDWPLLYYEFWSFMLRDRPDLRDEFAAREKAVRSALAEAIESGTVARASALRYPPERLAAVIRAVTNGLAFASIADPEPLDDDLVAFAVWAILQMAVEPQSE